MNPKLARRREPLVMNPARDARSRKSLVRLDVAWRRLAALHIYGGSRLVQNQAL